MSSEEVLELSVEETNKLRLKLGLKPLRGNETNATEELSLSIEDSNHLRAKLGLPPLRESSSSVKGTKPSNAIHVPASNTGTEEETRKRIETAKLKRDVERGLTNLISSTTPPSTTTSTPTDNEETVMDWAAKMRNNNTSTTTTSDDKAAKKKSSKMNNKKKVIKKQKKDKHNMSNLNRISIPQEEEEDKYEEKDLKGLGVSHDISEFEKGSSTILTLKDHSLIGDDDDEANILQNVNMVDDTRIQDNLKRKRQIEMGLGHAGGYVGYDDDEFIELGGSQQHSSSSSNNNNSSSQGENKNKKKIGFTIGSHLNNNENHEKKGNDLFAHEKGQAISLSSNATRNGELLFQSQADFLTHEEDVQQQVMTFSKKEEKKRKKEEKKKIKKLKKEKKLKKKSLRTKNNDNEDDNEQEQHTNDKTLLEELEGSLMETNDDIDTSQVHKRRRRTNIDSDDDDDNLNANKPPSSSSKQQQNDPPKEVDNDKVEMMRKQENFNRAVDKGNKRTAFVFTSSNSNKTTTSLNKSSSKVRDSKDDDDDDDDAFLSAALAKARRLQRLREMNFNSSKITTNNTKMDEKGASQVVESMKIMKEQSTLEKKKETSNNNDENSGLTFEYDETREFTRALRARSEKKKSNESNQQSKGGIQILQRKTKDQETKKDISNTSQDDDDEIMKNNEESLQELSKQIKDDPGNENLQSTFGTTGSTKPVGRGLANVLSMLKHTGEITGKNAGREEMRGRAKDKRTYEDYAPLDLKEVVKIQQHSANGSVPHEKDLEFANREISLEYRDEHGRLLTRKEAYRNLCYAFHGYGSSKKNQDRKLKQIERERGENSTVSKMLGETSGTTSASNSSNNPGSKGNGQGTFGALKATQRATGKAFVVHKT